MYFRKIYKSNENFKNDRHSRAAVLNQQRNEQRQNTRLSGYNIEILDIIQSSPLSAMTPEKIDQKQEFLNKRMEPQSSVANRPPFLNVVPVGRFIDPPPENLLKKLMLQTNYERRLTVPQPVLNSRSNRSNRRPLTTLTSNEIETVRQQTPSRHGKENNIAASPFYFLHSTARKSDRFREHSENDKTTQRHFIPDEPISPIKQFPVITKKEHKLNENETNDAPVPFVSPFVFTARGSRNTYDLNSDKTEKNCLNIDFKSPTDQRTNRKLNKGTLPKRRTKKVSFTNSPRSRLKNMLLKFRKDKLDQKNEHLEEEHLTTPRKSRARQSLLFTAVSQSTKKNTTPASLRRISISFLRNLEKNEEGKSECLDN